MSKKLDELVPENWRTWMSQVQETPLAELLRTLTGFLTLKSVMARDA